MGAMILLSTVTALGFTFACLALRQVRPAWFRMRASVGRWVAFSLEMDGRQETNPAAQGVTTPGHVSDQVGRPPRYPPTDLC